MLAPEIQSKYEATIGLEIHVQLATHSKMFCGCDNNSENAEPNTNVCPVCMGYPGTLPVMNEKAVEYGVRLAKALGCEINRFQRFDRKNYFYPDLPKGYQVSQFFFPVGEHGNVKIDHLAADRKTKKEFEVGITRLHLEEDAGKLSHTAEGTLVDLNRCGTPLAEIVTGPDLRTPEEAKAFMQELQRIVRAMGVSSADMEKGHLRVDGNISVRPVGQKELGSKVEIKNMNSFKFLEQALHYEIERQITAVEAGEQIVQETRGWDEKTGTTISQRIKEGSVDYRYFPEPDLPPLQITDEWLSAIEYNEGLLPATVRNEVAEKLNYGRAWELQDKGALEQFALLSKGFGGELDWLAKELLSGQEFSGVEDLSAKWEAVAADAKARADAWGDEAKLRVVIEQVISENADVAERFKAGESKLMAVFIGQVMAKTQGQADAGMVQRLITELLTNKE